MFCPRSPIERERERERERDVSCITNKHYINEVSTFEIYCRQHDKLLQSVECTVSHVLYRYDEMISYQQDFNNY